MSDEPNAALIDMTTGIVANYVGANKLSADELPALIASVYGALKRVGEPAEAVEQDEAVERPTAAQIRRSVSDAGIVSFLDGKTYQSLKRHLGTNGLTPDEYRARYGLRPDYPMVSPTYSARRSALAREAGLGSKGRTTQSKKPTGAKAAPGRPKKAK